MMRLFTPKFFFWNLRSSVGRGDSTKQKEIFFLFPLLQEHKANRQVVRACQRDRVRARVRDERRGKPSPTKMLSLSSLNHRPRQFEFHSSGDRVLYGTTDGSCYLSNRTTCEITPLGRYGITKKGLLNLFHFYLYPMFQFCFNSLLVTSTLFPSIHFIRLYIQIQYLVYAG